MVLYISIDVTEYCRIAENYRPWEKHANATVEDFSAMLVVTTRTPDAKDYEEFSTKV